MSKGIRGPESDKSFLIIINLFQKEINHYKPVINHQQMPLGGAKPEDSATKKLSGYPDSLFFRSSIP
ncbi:hypothetical protein C6Y45_16365 [Alkalicoccus saliphilus]|uniref:Uncharacterized protein n=1 Tax=Alkalicoccus saliphilus TaxID=200989 RepID=A0A2T4U223_9BACI|nr:hypothetical protein C6Y45_16365 [Alkalicoccus saliphilus]